MAMQLDNSGPAAVINVTPLIDVLLVLLIIFLVILPTYSVGLPVRAPQESAEAAPLVEERRTLVVTVMADGGVLINRQAFGAGEWAAKLERVLAGRADRLLYGGARYGVPAGGTGDRCGAAGGGDAGGAVGEGGVGIESGRIPDRLRTANPMITDAGIQQDIEKELRWDPGVNANHMAVSVKSQVVTLTGDVDSYWERCEAERAAWRVAHVKAVTNHLRVELPFSFERNDDDIALTAMTLLEWNCVVPASVEVQVAHGVATLSGTAAWQYQREEAERALAAVTGIKGIKNEIRLEPAAAAGEVRGAIDEALKRSALVDSSHVKAHVTQSTVSVRGVVKSRAEHDEALRAAWAAPGVTAVEDHVGIA